MWQHAALGRHAGKGTQAVGVSNDEGQVFPLPALDEPFLSLYGFFFFFFFFFKLFLSRKHL